MENENRLDDPNQLDDPQGDPKKLVDVLPSSDMPMLALLKVSQSAVIIGDEDGNILFFNDGASRLFGWTADEVAGKPVATIMPERYRAAHTAGINRIKNGDKKDILSSKVIGRRSQLHGLRKNGEEFLVEMQVVIYVQNEKICFLATITDLAESVKVAVAKSIESELTNALEKVQTNLANLDQNVAKINDQIVTVPPAP